MIVEITLGNQGLAGVDTLRRTGLAQALLHVQR